MNCPNCSSDQTQRLSAIYEAGTSVVESKLSGGGVALTPGGLAPVLGSGSSRACSRRRSPRRHHRLRGSPSASSFSSLCWAAPFSRSSRASARLSSWPDSARRRAARPRCCRGSSSSERGCSFPRSASSGSSSATASTATSGLGLYAAWQARWLCHRCGELFEPRERRAAA